MKSIFILLIAISMIVILTGCTENYSNGERIGMVTQFSRTGWLWKSWEGHLNLTQTGMNSSSMTPFDFSIDNDREEMSQDVIKTIDSAANYGWKVKLIYHETAGKNWLSNRGATDHFIVDVKVLDRDPVAFMHNGNSENSKQSGGHDTIYVVIVPKDKVLK